MRLFILISFLFLNVNKGNSQSIVWTKEYKDTLYKVFYSSANNLLTSETDKAAFAKCIVVKFEQIFPKGLEKYPKEEIAKQSEIVGQVCAKEIKGTVIINWTPLSEAIVLKNLNSTKSLQLLSDKARASLCNCMVLKLKKIYPIGFPYPLSKEIQNLVSDYCAKQLLKNK